MSQLNKIFYGPAGTGKTREAIFEAIRIIEEDFQSNLDESTTYEFFKEYSEQIKFTNQMNKELFKKINVDNFTINSLTGDDKNILNNGNETDRELEDRIKKSKSYPLIETITFHPNYSYQDFLEGISVVSNNENISYEIKDGIFKKICKRALNYPDNKYVLIIDEINRGDISSIFGELFTLIEDSKRKNINKPNYMSMSINLPYSKDNLGNPEKIEVPNNLYIIGTMNTVDKSLAMIDIALRRRFDFIECKPNYNVLENKLIENTINLKTLLETINKRINVLKNENYELGQALFYNNGNIISSLKEIQNIFVKKIIPLLKEYFYDDWNSINAVLNQTSFKNDSIILKDINIDDLFDKSFKDDLNIENQEIYYINKNFSINGLKEIIKSKE